jgi:riboflavin kinase/FMN adenylyltransferase
MQLLRSLDRLPPELTGGAVAIGNFDGVHRGHARLVERLVAQARRVGGRSVVFTFDPHPLAILHPQWLPTPMTRSQRKAELLERLGVDAVIAYPTDRELLNLTPQQFFDAIVRERLRAQAIVEGPNFHFGKDRAGDAAVLRRLCDQAHLMLEIVEPLAVEEELISSSRVRNLIQSGAIGQANQLLTQPYRLSGIVGRGAQRGRTIGFPTANLEQIQTVLPALGVYAGRALVQQDRYAAAINIGPNPTFGENAVKIEIHLIDFSGNLYDQPLSVDLLDRLRDIHSFPNVQALIDQLRLDIGEVREVCSCTLPSVPCPLPSDL